MALPLSPPTARRAPTSREGEAVRPRVLVIDPNETTRSVLEVALGRDDFDVVSAASGAKGLELLHHGPAPDVVVMESELGGAGELPYLAQLRANSTAAEAPVLLLSRAPSRELEGVAEALGVAAVVQKPVFARDVVALARLEHLRRLGGSPEIEFQASRLPAAQLLRAVLAGPYEGRLVLLGGRGEVVFRPGRVVRVRAGRGRDSEALVRALALTRGPYVLSLEPAGPPRELDLGPRELVSMVMPRLARWEPVRERGLSLEAHLVVDFTRLSRAIKGLPDGVHRVVQLFDGHRAVEDVLLDSPLNETLTMEVIGRLAALGVVVPQPLAAPQAPVPSTEGPASSAADPRASVQVMTELFGPTPALASPPPVADPTVAASEDWFTEPVGSGLDVADPAGGWRAASAREVAKELAPELDRQLEAFRIRPRIEDGEAPASPELRAFLRGDDDVFTALDDAVRVALGGEALSAPPLTPHEVLAALGGQERPAEATDVGTLPPRAPTPASEALAVSGDSTVAPGGARTSTDEMDDGGARTAADLLAEALGRAWPVGPRSTLGPPETPQASSHRLAPPEAGEAKAAAAPSPSSLGRLPMVRPEGSDEPEGRRVGATSIVTPALPGMFSAPSWSSRATAEAQPSSGPPSARLVAESPVPPSPESPVPPSPEPPRPAAGEPLAALEATFFESAGNDEPEAPSTPGASASSTWAPRAAWRPRGWLLASVGLVVLLVLASALLLAPRPAAVSPTERPEPRSAAVTTTVEPEVAPAPAPSPEPVAPQVAPAEDAISEAAEPTVVTAAEPAPLRRARGAYEAGQYARARVMLEEFVRREPEAVAAWLLLGQVRYDERDVSGARRAAERVVALAPRNAPVQMLLASLSIDARDRQAARRALQRYLELEPSGPFAAEARSLLRR